MIDQGTGVGVNNADLLKGLSPADLTLAALQAAYPVTSVYFSLVNVNPATSLGFGTWNASATGAILGVTVYMWDRTA